MRALEGGARGRSRSSVTESSGKEMKFYPTVVEKSASSTKGGCQPVAAPVRWMLLIQRKQN